MQKRHIIMSTLLSLLIVAGVGACRHGHHHGGFDEFDLEAATNRIASRLDLSDTQKAELKEIIADIASQAKVMRADRETRHREMAALVRQDAIAPESVEMMINDRFDQMKVLAEAVASRLIAFHATLSLEQREKIAAYIEEHAAADRGFFRR
jgi:uncharacterized membrane protein